MALGGKSAPTLGRDTTFAVLMIVLNAAIGLCLLLGGLHHHAQAYNLQGAVAYLAVIIPLSLIALILPDFQLECKPPCAKTRKSQMAHS
jgi:Ca2+:H+ antiporter